MSNNERLQAALEGVRQKLGLESISLPFRKSFGNPSAGIDEEGVMVYNPTVVNNIDDDELQFMVAMMYKLQFELPKLKDKDIFLWNMATNIAITHELEDLGFTPIEDVFAGTFKKYKGQSAEEIYAELVKNGDLIPT